MGAFRKPWMTFNFSFQFRNLSFLFNITSHPFIIPRMRQGERERESAESRPRTQTESRLHYNGQSWILWQIESHFGKVSCSHEIARRQIDGDPRCPTAPNLAPANSPIPKRITKSSYLIRRKQERKKKYAANQSISMIGPTILSIQRRWNSIGRAFRLNSKRTN